MELDLDNLENVSDDELIIAENGLLKKWAKISFSLYKIAQEQTRRLLDKND